MTVQIMVTTNTSTIVAMQVRIVRTLLRRRFLKMSRRNFIVAFVVPVDWERASKLEFLRLIYGFVMFFLVLRPFGIRVRTLDIHFSLLLIHYSSLTGLDTGRFAISADSQ
jgi:hypothetical protein